MQDAAEPSSHTPRTVTFAAGACAAVCRVTVASAVHVFCWFTLEPSRSPTWITSAGGAVTVTVPLTLVSAPLASMTVRPTVYVPAARYRWRKIDSQHTVSAPRSHRKYSCVPSGSDDAEASYTQFRSMHAAVNDATGGVFRGVFRTENVRA